MKEFLKNNIISLIFTLLLFIGVGTVFSASITPIFPTTANLFEEGDVIEEEDWNALENTIGTTATTSRSTLFGRWNDLFASTTMPQITTLANLTTVKTSLTGILKVTAGVLSVATPNTDYATFSYPFPSAATSTLLTFSGGIMSTASSTITDLTITNSTTTNATTTNLAIDVIYSDATDGAQFKTNSGLNVANFGLANSQNALFYGGVNITGTLGVTGLATFANASTTGTLTIHEICNEEGVCWDSPTILGSDVSFFPTSATSNIGTYNDMLTIPSTAAAVDDSCSADSDVAGGYCSIDTYVSTTTDVTILNYPAGVTKINAHGYVDSSTGVSSLVFDGYRRQSNGTETWLGQATSTEIDNTTTDLHIASFTGATETAFSSDGTDRLVLKVRGHTTSNVAKTVHWTYQNSSEYSYIETPITVSDEGFVKSFNNETITGSWSFSSPPTFSTLTSALVITGVGGLTAEYTGTSCTNQFVRSLSALGVATCATVGASDVSLANLTATDATLTFSGTYNGSTARTIGLNLSNPNTWTGLQQFSNATSTQFSAGTGNVFYVDGNGRIQGKDTTNAWSGVISPTRSFGLTSGTTTTWTASTTNSAYSPYLVMPFTGTLKQVRCATDASFLGVNVQVNGSNATPSYFVASTTIGTVSFTAGNTFTVGQKVLANFGTTTQASALSISCTFDATETY